MEPARGGGIAKNKATSPLLINLEILQKVTRELAELLGIYLPLV